MCGICGYWDPAGGDREAMTALAAAMAARMAHRGPDDAGAWADADAGLALGHRRLSIIDLSPAGHQPMTALTGSHVIAYNGEVYNFAEIRRDLEAADGPLAWRGESDTEVILEAAARKGLDEVLPRMNGMFALALWDAGARRLHLCRDRLGQKPLYYGWSGGVFFFASELSAMRAHPAFRPPIDRGALALFLRHNYVPAPWSIYEGIHKLPPGCRLELGPELRPGELPRPVPYWSAREMAQRGVDDPLDLTPVEAATELERLLLDAVGLRMIADVPLGAFLSGGVDSSLVAALMQAQSARPVKTFSIGFEDTSFDEAPYAREVARHLGTDHTEMYVTERDALETVPRLPAVFDEPFSDSSQIPTLLVSRIARSEVTVALSGDAGDELFAGYERYFVAQGIWQRAQGLPGPLKRLGAWGLKALTPAAWDRLFGLARPCLPRRLHWKNPGERAWDLAGLLAAPDAEAFYRGLVSHEKRPARLALGAEEPRYALTDPAAWIAAPDLMRRMMFLDLVTYLPDDILVKVDRTSMAVSLEARCPLLDYRVVELAWRLAPGLKAQGSRGKLITREILYQHVPRELIERPKMGFGVPLAAWLRGPLRDWAEALLDESRLRREGFLEPSVIRARWDEHLSGRRAWHYYLWDVLVFQQWLEHSGGGA